MSEPQRLEKKLGLFGIYAIATGATLSAGFFLLPGLAFAQAGPAMVLCYMLAAIPLVPAMLSKIELGTAMPRAGGIYYFLDRAMGPLVGTIGGFGTWVALVLKVSFALVGMGAYLEIFFPELPVKAVAIGLALALGVVNLRGAEKSTRIQMVLVAGLLGILGFFLASEIPSVRAERFHGFFDSGWDAIIATTGLVYISYVGITNVISLSEEIINPDRNLPRGIFLSIGTAILIYLVGTIVLVGVLPPEKLSGTLTPVAAAAAEVGGRSLQILVSVAALLAFVSVANAGTMSASRYPLAMSRDGLLPRRFQRVNSRGIPATSVVYTVVSIIVILLVFDVRNIAKLASAFQLLMFAMVCLSAVVMRESRIEAYDPSYRAPWYPYLQIIGIVAPIFLIVEMGLLPTAFSAGLIAFGTIWYLKRARHHVDRSGAIFHVFERLGQNRHEGIDTELRTILKEKGLRHDDPFDEVVARSFVLDFHEPTTFEEVVERSIPWIATHVETSADELKEQILAGERLGATPVARDVALPHFRDGTIDHAQLVLARGRQGIVLAHRDEESGKLVSTTVRAVILLVSPKRDPGQHLRLLAQIAGHVEDQDFKRDWGQAIDEQELKEVLLREERWLSLIIHHGAKTEVMIGVAVQDLALPDGSLVAMLRRGELVIVPRGNTVLEAGDRLTIIGEPEVIAETLALYFGEPA